MIDPVELVSRVRAALDEIAALVAVPPPMLGRGPAPTYLDRLRECGFPIEGLVARRDLDLPGGER